MLKLVDGMTLYHGSYCEIVSPNLDKCAPYKDFGKGFYLTTSYEQAKKFINTSLKKAKSQGVADANQNYGVITTFKYHASESLHIKTFDNADSDWLHCVVAHRKDKSFPNVIEELKDYDIVVGKIADDATNFTIIAYIAGTYGDIGSEEVDAAKALSEFIASETGKLLYDEESKLWWNGPSYIVDMYLKEKKVS